MNCNDTDNEIVFRHAQFLTNDNRIKICNAGAIRGQSLSVVDDRYTSRLNVSLTSEMIGETITCIHNTISFEEITSAIFIGITML